MSSRAIISSLPKYEPKVHVDDNEIKKIDLNIRDMQTKYPIGCMCCGNTYLPKRYSSMISQHFTTSKHKKLCIIPTNEDLKNNFGNSKDIYDAFDQKCREIRELKKLNYQYKDELEKLKTINETMQNINLSYQKTLVNYKKSDDIPIANLIDI